jgi:hypothetical protein
MDDFDTRRGEEKEKDERVEEADLCSNLLRWKMSRQDGNRIPSTSLYVDVLVHRVCSLVETDT